MVTPAVPSDELERCVSLAREVGISEAARRLGLPRSTLQSRLRTARAAAEGAVSYTAIPEDDLPIEELIRIQAKRFEKRAAAQQAKDWQPVRVNEKKAIGLLWFGDPHVDDSGCNWPLLLKHIALCKNDGVYGANVGDTTNNWCGKLMRLYAEQETSKTTARKLAKWFLTESGVDWLIWLMGNHDEWADGAEFLRLYNVNGILMENWQARFQLVFPNGKACRIHAAHNFPGNSIWNSLHGPQRAAHTKAEAHLYMAGHTHNWALHHEESASRGFTYWLARARGYKYLDDYADHLGHHSQQEGAAIMTIIDPNAKSASGFVQCFADPEEGAEFLKWKRSKA